MLSVSNAAVPHFAHVDLGLWDLAFHKSLRTKFQSTAFPSSHSQFQQTTQNPRSLSRNLKGDREDPKFVVHHVHHAEVLLAATEKCCRSLLPPLALPYRQDLTLLHRFTYWSHLFWCRQPALVLLRAATCTWSTQDLILIWLLNV